MRRALLLLIPALAWSQALPMAWPDLPQGALSALRHPAAFTGASVLASDGDWILAWCDMRDGQGRLMVNKVEVDQPGGSGTWHGDCAGLGDMSGLCIPTTAIAPYLPVLIADQSGGAYVLWQDADVSYQGDLMLQRVVDGQHGQGAFAWPEPMLLAEGVALPEQDCRGPESRCRDWTDAWRQIAEDGLGGAWISWRATDGGLRLQHVDAQGDLLPTLPATGLVLPFTSWYSKLVGDGQGGARLFGQVQADAALPLMVCGVNADGSWTTPEQARILQAGTVGHFSAATVGAGTTVVVWANPDGLQAQLLDEQLQDVWPEGGLLLAPGPTSSVKVAVAPGGEPQLAVSWIRSGDSQPEAQVLTTQGEWLWPEPVGLDLVADDQAGYVGAMTIDEAGLLYLLRESDGLHLQRVLPSGHGQWPAGSTHVGEVGQAFMEWNLATDSQGGALCGISRVESGDRLLRFHHRTLHRLADGGEPVDPAQTVFLVENWEYGGHSRLVNDKWNPLTIWAASDTLFASALDASTGEALWGLRERPLVCLPWVEVIGSVPTEDGAWLLISSLVQPSSLRVLHVLQVDGQGQVLAGPVDVAPGLIGEQDYFDTAHESLVACGDGVAVAFECQLGMNLELRLQRFSATGQRLLGESGLTLPPASSTFTRLLGAARMGNGSIGVIWTPWTSAQADFYLQAVTMDGQLQFPENGGRGVHLDLIAAPFGFDGEVVAMPDGAILCSLTDYQSDATTHWSVLRITPQGSISWRHTEASLNLTLPRLLPDDQGSLWMGRCRQEQSLLHLQVERRTLLGDLERVWSLPRDPSATLQDWNMSAAEGTGLLALMEWTTSSTGARVEAWSLPEGDPVALAAGDAPFVSGVAWNPLLAPAPQGDVYLSWEERRGLSMGYGEQSRLARLDLQEDNAAVDPIQARTFTLDAASPNPFNPLTRLAFTLAKAGPARLEVFNLAGQRVRLLHQGILAAGRHTYAFDARSDSGQPLSSGLYFCRLVVGEASQTQRMLLLR